LLLALASCHSLFGYDEDYVEVASAGVGGGAGGAAPECSVAAECTGVDTTCSFRVCAGGDCAIEQAASGTTCSEDGGSVCDDGGACVECLVDADCSNGACQSNECVAPTCVDGEQNGSETDLDCGGSCAPCLNGQSCSQASDCDSQFCDGSSCGPCGGDSDCAAVADSYCDGSNCVAKKQNGDNCTNDSQCLSGNCPGDDSVCCDAACGALCAACLMTKTGSPNGQCANVSAGQDPDTECGDTGAASCGVAGMGCSGTGPSCVLYDNTTECVAPVCSAGQQTTAGMCDGVGMCVLGTTSACAPYLCNGGASACITSCGSAADCIANHYCSVGSTCEPLKANGVGCGANGQCLSGLCSPDGVCCDDACGGTCESCLGALTGGSDGTCAAINAYTDPDMECLAGQLCNGSGSCQLDDGEGCGAPGECITGFCAYGVCCTSACSGVCQSCVMADTGSPDGTCGVVTDGIDPNDSCVDPQICLNGGCFTCDQRPAGTGPDVPCPSPCDSCSGGVCTVNCAGANECDGNNINCPAGYECVVNCTGKQSCKTANINCPDTHACTVTCNAEQACELASIDCSADGACLLSCGNSTASQDCKEMVMNCGDNTCEATCAGGETPTVNGCSQSACAANCSGC
jgi:hypothetical protein